MVPNQDQAGGGPWVSWIYVPRAPLEHEHAEDMNTQNTGIRNTVCSFCVPRVPAFLCSASFVLRSENGCVHAVFQGCLRSCVLRSPRSAASCVPCILRPLRSAFQASCVLLRAAFPALCVPVLQCSRRTRRGAHKTNKHEQGPAPTPHPAVFWGSRVLRSLRSAFCWYCVPLGSVFAAFWLH